LVISPGSELILNPVLGSYVSLMVLGLLLGIGLDVFLLWRGRWETGSRIAKIAINLFGIGVLSVLVVAHNTWLADHGMTGIFSFVSLLPAGSQLSNAQAQILVVNGFRIGLIVALITTVVDTVAGIFRLIRRLFKGQAVSGMVIKKY
jgi:hypothetical protein